MVFWIYINDTWAANLPEKTDFILDQNQQTKLYKVQDTVQTLNLLSFAICFQFFSE